MAEWLARQVFFVSCWLGQPFGGVRPHRIYRWLAHAGFKQPRPRWVTTARGLRMKLCPFYMIDREILAFGQYDAALHAFYDRFVQPGMVCLDVGANIGDSTLHLAQRVGDAGHVHAFEPAPLPYGRLCEHISVNRLTHRATAHELALSDRTGKAEFATAGHDVENQGMGSLVSRDNRVASMTLTVCLETLDAFAASNALPRIDLVKLDIQGSEIMFFEGAKETLKRTRPTVLMEVSPVELRAINRTPAELIAAIESLDYHVHVLGAQGSPGSRICGIEVADDFEASNVVCVPA